MVAAISIDALPAQMGLKWLVPTMSPEISGLKEKALELTDASIPNPSPCVPCSTEEETMADAVGKMKLNIDCCRGI